jgi:hypothetical protein
MCLKTFVYDSSFHKTYFFMWTFRTVLVESKTEVQFTFDINARDLKLVKSKVVPKL